MWPPGAVPLVAAVPQHTHLHRDEPVVHLHLLGEKVRSNGGLILTAELLVNVLVHQRRLAHAAARVRQRSRPHIVLTEPADLPTCVHRAYNLPAAA